MNVGCICSTNIRWKVVWDLSFAKLSELARSSTNQANIFGKYTHCTCSNIISLSNFALIHIDFAIFMKDIFVALDDSINNVEQFLLFNSIETTLDIHTCKVQRATIVSPRKQKKKEREIILQ